MTAYFLDTNILWWYLTKTSKHYKKVKSYIDELIKDLSNTFYVNEFVMIELFHMLVKYKGKKGFQVAKKMLDNQFPFINILYDISDLTSLDKILDELLTYGMTTSIGGRDCSIIFSMKLHGIKDIVTNDGGYNHISEIQPHNPLG